MDPSRQRRLARLLLALGVLCAAAWLARLDFGRKITTDLLDLIPPDERMPELMLARSLATAEHARVAFFALEVPERAGGDAAGAVFLQALHDSGAFAEVLRLDDAASRDALGRFVFEQRLDLLAPGWLARERAAWRAAGAPEPWSPWLADRVASALDAFLSRPEAVPFQDLLPSDPLLLMPELAGQVQGLAELPGDEGGPLLIWARARGDPLNEAEQERVLAAVDHATRAVQATAPDATLRWVAISRFAAENRHRIRREIETLNAVSIVAVLGIAALGLRRVHAVLHLAPVLLCAILAAWVGVTAVFDRVHVLVFVVGSLLGGVAIDYGFYLQLQPPLYPGEPYATKVRRLLRPLLSSSLTTVLGFLLLVVSDLPLIRQLGVFISAGLLGALAAALLWFGQLRTAVAESRWFLQQPVPMQHRRAAWLRWAVLGAGAVIALAGPWLITWRDDIRSLEALPQSLRDEQAAVRALFGQGPDRTAYITRGDSPGEAREALAEFVAAHAETYPQSGVASLGLVLPEPGHWAALDGHLAELPSFAADLASALERHGFEREAFAPFFDTWAGWSAARERPGYDQLVAGLRAHLRGPLALTLSTEPGASWFMTIADHPPGDRPVADASTIALDRLQTLNELFHRHRVSALRLSTIGLALVGASVLWIYGPRRGWRIFLLPCSASLFAFGVFGLAGHELNLFHLLGAFLGVCLSHNYAIFSAENARWSAAPAPSVRLSAATTAVSFGLLGLSAIPVVAALGTTVAIIVAAALVMVELAPPARHIPA